MQGKTDLPRRALSEVLESVRNHIHQICLSGHPQRIWEIEEIEKLVGDLSSQDLYFLIMETGLGEAADLLALTSQEQLRTFMDLDVWRKDRLDTTRLMDWLDVGRSHSIDTFEKMLLSVDQELLALVVAQNVAIRDLTITTIPEGASGGYVMTPDTFFALLPIDDDQERFRRVSDYVNEIYRVDMELGRRTVQNALWSIPAEMEEDARRFRVGRLTDEGFSDYFEALEVYQYLKPSSVRVGEGTADPIVAAAEKVGTIVATSLVRSDTPITQDFFGACLDRIEDPAELGRLSHAAASLTNRLMAADAVREVDIRASFEYMRLARRYLSLGLEYLCQSDPANGPKTLGTVSLLRIYRAGFSLTLDLKRLVTELWRLGRISLAPFGATLMDPPFIDLVEALTCRRPELSRAFDDPVDYAVSCDEPAGRRPIETLADIRHAARLVEELAGMWTFCFVHLKFPLSLLTHQGLDGTVSDDPSAISLGDIFRTAVVCDLSSGRFQPDPLTKKAVADFIRFREKTKEAHSALVERAMSKVRLLVEESDRKMEVDMERVVRWWCAPLAFRPMDSIGACLLLKKTRTIRRSHRG